MFRRLFATQRLVSPFRRSQPITSYHNISGKQNTLSRGLFRPSLLLLGTAACAATLVGQSCLYADEEKEEYGNDKRATELAEDASHAHGSKRASAARHVPEEMIQQLQEIFGENCILDQSAREPYGKDFSYNKGKTPDVVVVPTKVEQIQKVVELCAKHKVPIVAYGAGTSLEGHINAVEGGGEEEESEGGEVPQMIEVHAEDMLCVVEPGITYDELNQKLKPYGYFFPMDPGPGASIGGMVGTSCSGTNAYRYGTMKENVLSLNVVLPSGKMMKTRQRAKKSSAGYDLNHLFIGAEGTLGVVTQVTLKIQKIPQNRAVALAQFETIRQAANVAISVVQEGEYIIDGLLKYLKKGIQIGKIELLDDVMMKAVNLNNGTEYKELTTLLFEFAGSELSIKEQRNRIEELTKENNGSKLQFATEQEDREALWMARKTALWSAPILKEGSEVKITDVCVPISKIADCIQQTKDDIRDSTLLGPIVGHMGDGNFHSFILLDPNNPKDLEETHRLDHRMIERAISMGGTCTGEHGVGVGKRDYLPLELGEEAVELMRTLKRAIDPDNIMNPGKVMPDKEPIKKED
ncbi:hypothetical protein PROFUN_09582 [Planoprotostelium fungivorum]|uniref:D-lactate dehydrogenase (cytochrome) n=1 Tax=Planoprotostelium fungivorum TaxID=1890364 RepID=A0A2P6NGS4_9EUKA|nr:hypothetical protein PROFUN_09582 [Planoprotostelium fungivorum]